MGDNGTRWGKFHTESFPVSEGSEEAGTARILEEVSEIGAIQSHCIVLLKIKEICYEDFRRRDQGKH